MIDFRYHLVSLISVFLALAVGIVLGAGPLRENLGDQLTGQVEQLRSEQEDLRAQSEELATKNDQLATFIGEIGPQLVSDTLPGAEVVVLTDDATLRPPVEKLTGLLEEAGVSAVSRVDLQPALWEPGQEQRRADAIAEISQIAPSVLDPALEDREQLAESVVTLLTAPADGELTPELRSQVWQALVDQQLISLSGTIPPVADAVVFASAAPQELEEDSDDDTAATERAQGLLSAQTALLTELKTAGTPAVVAGVTPDNDGTQGILRTVRGDSTYQGLSTTDRLSEADGPLLAVLALVEQTRGGAGSYGTTTDARARLPQLPETQPLQDATQDPSDASAPEGPAASDGGGEG